MLNHAHVPGVHDKGAPVLADLEILPGTGLFYQMILPAAGLCALPTVCVTPGQIIGEQTAPGKADTHGTVDKGLDVKLLRGIVPDLPNVLQGRLPGQDYRVGTKGVEGIGCGAVDNAELRAHVPCNLGCMALGKLQYAQIRNDQSIHAGVLQEFQISGQHPQLLLPGKGVAGHIDLDVSCMRILYGPAEIRIGKVHHAGAHAKLASGKIHGVRPVKDGHFQPLPVAGRGQQFHFTLHSPGMRRTRQTHNCW